VGYLFTNSGDVGMGTSAGDYVSAAASAVSSTVSSILGTVQRYREIEHGQSMLAAERQAGVTSWLDQMAQQEYMSNMDRAERDAENAARKATTEAYRSEEARLSEDIRREQEEAFARESARRVGGVYGARRPLSVWAWVGIGVAAVGLTAGGVWAVSRINK
jgi:hypothetical protein